MKLNWGFGIFVLYTGFVLFILFMVFRSSQEKVDLVTEDYYQKELEYQEIINFKANAENLEEGLTYKIEKNEIDFIFPEQQKSISGNIQIYRPSNDSFDQFFEIKLDDQNQMKVNLGNTPMGLYKMMIKWNNNSIGYYVEKDIYLKP
jgi:hypothetical protein